MELKTPSKLEKIMAAGHLAVTSEVGPPRSCDGGEIEHKGHLIKEYVDAVNVTDNQTSVVRLCSLASCIRLKQMGIEPILQMTTRDRNRIAMQSDILGAASWGIHNMLCLTGDHQTFGDHPMSANVFDLDSVQLIQTVKLMRDEGKLLSGFEMKVRPQIFIGAAENPFAGPNVELRALRLGKKIAAGVEFIQTQCIYNVPKFKEWMKIAVDKGYADKAYIMAGITPFKSLGMARYMKTKVPGMDVPDDQITRLKGVPKEKQAEEGIKMAIEMMQELKEVPGVKGFHIMAIEWEEKVPELVKGAGLYPRPQV
ncbi:MAG: methylenetetrahydrofolate reductase [Desulfobacca sp.]|uniref:methylenetetrahydrofolate reductase n=1 Tax=Desulfobacca sp. TaxID=2067990 RepID=UPI00404B31D7